MTFLESDLLTLCRAFDGVTAEWVSLHNVTGSVNVDLLHMKNRTRCTFGCVFLWEIFTKVWNAEKSKINWYGNEEKEKGDL
jgi:hypothetical protein